MALENTQVLDYLASILLYNLTMRFCSHFTFIFLATLASVFFSTSASAQANYESPAATFNHYGERVHVYATEYAGVYTDKDLRRWIFIPDVVGAAGRVNQQRNPHVFQNWQDRGDFKLLENASREEIERAKQLDPTRVQGVFTDHRGAEWVLIPDPEAPKDRQRMYYVRLETLSAEEMVAAFSQTRSNFLTESIRAYPAEQIKFSTALLIVQMSKCFGGGIADLSFQVKSSASTPACVDDFIAHLLDPKGWASFYFFILGNRMASQALMKVALLTAAHTGNKNAIPMLRQKIAPFLGYMGMAVGSLFSSISMHVLSAPSWGQCAELLASEGHTSLPCREAYTHFLSVEDFWGDFGGETIALISAAVAAHTTQVILKNSYQFAQALTSNMRNGYRIQAGTLLMHYSDAKAIEYTGKMGIKAIKNIRLVKGALAVVGGVPGFFVFVTTELGGYVLFLAWDEILRGPIMHEYHAATKTVQVNQAMQGIQEAFQKTQELGWEKPYLAQECEIEPGMWRLMLHAMARAPLPHITKKCRDVSPLDINLEKFKTGAQRFRQHVLLNKMDEAAYNWKNKISSYLNSYRSSKLVLEYIHQMRDQKHQTHLDVWLTAVYFTGAWNDILEREIPLENDFKREVQRRFLQMQPLIEDLGVLYDLENQTNPESSIQSLYQTWKRYFQNLVYWKQSSDKQKLKELLIEAKQYIEKNAALATYAPGLGMPGLYCDYTPRLCRTLSDYQDVRFEDMDIKESSVFLKEDHTSYINYLVYTFGSKTVNQSLYEMFCSENREFYFEGVNDNGRKGVFRSPLLLSMNETEYREFRRKNCTRNGYPIYEFQEEDFSRPWFFKDKVYPDPISMAMDQDLPLVSGETAQQARDWWNINAFPKTMEFVTNSVVNYQNLLQREYLPLIPENSVEELIQKSQVALQGNQPVPAMDFKIVTSGFLIFGQQPTLSQSIMGQVLFALHHVKYTLPLENNSRKRVQELSDQLAQEMAKLILSFKGISSPSVIENQMRGLRNDLVELTVTPEAIDITLRDFENNVGEIVIPGESYDQIIQSMQSVNSLSSELYHEITGMHFDEMTDEKVRYRSGLTEEELRNVSKQEYKKYIAFKLIHENINDIVLDYLTLDLYKKLSLQPLLEITNPESL